MTAMIAALLGVYGALVGSFLNVVVLRFHAGKDFIRGGSECPNCGRRLRPWELIPVISWVLLRGRCAGCRKPISVQYPLVEAVTAAVFVLAYLHLGPSTWFEWVKLLVWLYVFGAMIVLAVYDLRWKLLPDKILLPLIIPAALLLLFNTIQSGDFESLYKPLAAALLLGGIFYLMAAVSDGRWMGGGDIKLVFVMGLLLGVRKTAVALLLAFVAAAIIGSLLLLRRTKQRNSQIPFGPFLVLGTLTSFLWGSELIHWYLVVSGLDLITS